MRRADQGDVAFPGQQARGGVQADPASAGQVRLSPGVQIGEVGDAARRPVQGRFVGAQLHKVTRDEPSGQAEPAQDLDEQPRAVPARPDRLFQESRRAFARPVPCERCKPPSVPPAG